MVELTPPRQQERCVKVSGEYLRKPEIIHALCILYMCILYIYICVCAHCIHLCTHYVCIIIYRIYVCSCDTVSLYVCVYINTVYVHVMLYYKILWKSVERNVSDYAYVL